MLTGPACRLLAALADAEDSGPSDLDPGRQIARSKVTRAPPRPS